MMSTINRYMELYEDMASSGDKRKMIAFGEAEKWAFGRMTEISPRDARKWLDKLEAMEWNNYLSLAEAEEIVAGFVSQSGARGPHWGYDAFRNAVESLGGKMSDTPFYNCFAMWATANMLYSDHANSVAEDMGYSAPSQVPNEKMALSMYRKALEKLKDADRPRFVREYFM